MSNTMRTAIFAHLTKLGIPIPVGDQGELFGLAVVVFVGSLGVLYFHRSEIPVIGPKSFSYTH